MLQPPYDDEFNTDQNLIDALDHLCQVDSRGIYSDSNNLVQVP